MHSGSKRQYTWAFLSLILIMAVGYYLGDNFLSTKPGQLNDNYLNTDYITIKDASGNIILQTGLPVSLDDEFISEDNTHYVITSVDGESAIARTVQDSFAQKQSKRQSTSSQAVIPTVAANKPIHIVVYHTHTDESYIPDSGTDFESWDGDVLHVGTAFANALRKSGASVNHSANRHEPHDIHAYNRSRRTLYHLLKEQPDAVFDIHRDAAPAETYITSVNGINAGRVMIVVGRSNPNLLANLEFAWQIKDAADDLYPGLMRGIFIGRGNYNQDLYPSALLFEVGSQNITVDNAYKAVNCLSDAVLTALNQR